jgi:3-ketosteroid 9alpha-monooxygenase subunit B
MSTGKRPGHRVTVIEVIEETADARSLVFRIPAELKSEFRYRPGQFLTLNVPSRQEPTARCYSLASSPYVDGSLKVTVKRTAGGYASNLLCSYPEVPFAIEVLKPSGSFTPESLDADFALLAGGSGVTPIMSILKSVIHAGRGHCRLFYANRDAASTIFRHEIEALAADYPQRFTVEFWDEDRCGGVPTAEAVSAFLTASESPEVFTCGPAPFMALVRRLLAETNIPHHQVHFEEFVSLDGDPFAPIAGIDSSEMAGAATVEVELDGEEYELQWPRTRSLVDVMLNEGIDVPYSCRSGECGSCVCTLVTGQVKPGDVSLLDPEDIAEGVILGCQAMPLSDRLRVEF